MQEQFVARTDESSFFREFVKNSRIDSGEFKPSAFLIQAPSGAGKSRLVDECLKDFSDVIHIRIELSHQHSYRGFRIEFLNAVMSQYRNILNSGKNEQFSDWLWSFDKNRGAIDKAITSVADGLTFGAVTAIKSLLSMTNSKTEKHIADLFSEQNDLEDWIEELVIKLGNRFAVAITISNVQQLVPTDIEYLFEICSVAKYFLTLEFTTNNFQHGVIDREKIAYLAKDNKTKVSALVLGPLHWKDACEISQHLGQNDEWAKTYYERHGFNLFDLKNLSGPDGNIVDSICIDDFSFGPTVLPGIKNRYPATRQKLLSLSKDEKLILCLVFVHGGSMNKNSLLPLLPDHLVTNQASVILEELRLKHKFLKNGKEERTIHLAHDSIVMALEDCLEFLPIIKLSAKLWQTFYLNKFSQLNDESTSEPAFECSIRLAYFSALIYSNEILLDACQSIFALSRYVIIEGNVRKTFLQILNNVYSSTLVPTRMRPVIAYYLGASAINFRDLELASEVAKAMEANSLGAEILQAFIFQKMDKYMESNSILRSLEKSLTEHLSTQDILQLELLGVINEHSLSNSSQKIEKIKKVFRELVDKSQAFPEFYPSILKHASIGYGYHDSLPLLTDSIDRLQKQGDNFQASQAKLIKLMQLTRLGKIEEALKLLRSIEDVFPKNFSEETNLLNIQALLSCFQFQKMDSQIDCNMINTRNLFQKAKRLCKDEYRKLVLASNLFVFDHFLNTGSNQEAQKEKSYKELVYRLENSSIGFRYLYVLGWYNLMRYHESINDNKKAAKYRKKIGIIDETDSLLWRCAMGVSNPTGTEVEFLVSTPYMLAFLPNYQISPPFFKGRVDSISEIIS